MANAGSAASSVGLGIVFLGAIIFSSNMLNGNPASLITVRLGIFSSSFNYLTISGGSLSSDRNLNDLYLS